MTPLAPANGSFCTRFMLTMGQIRNLRKDWHKYCFKSGTLAPLTILTKGTKVRNFGNQTIEDVQMGSYYLRLEQGPLQKAIHPLSEQTMIGRSSDNTITLGEPIVSRRHAVVKCQDGDWLVDDLGSANSAISNGTRIDKMILNPGDCFQIGETVFHFLERKAAHDSNEFADTVEIMARFFEDYRLLTEKGDVEPWKKRLQSAIDAIPFFSYLTKKEKKILADSGTLYLFTSGELVIKEGATDRSIYVILDGKLKVSTRDDKGKELELATLRPGEFVGEMSFLTGKPRSGSVIALDNTVLIELSYKTMNQLTQQSPSVKQVLSRFCKDRLTDAEEKRALFSRNSSSAQS